MHERVAQQLAGHADSRTERDIYTHVTGSMLEGATDAIEQAARGVHGTPATNGSSNGSSASTKQRDGQPLEEGKPL